MSGDDAYRGTVSRPPIPVMRPRLPEPRTVAARLDQIHDAGTYSNFGPQVRELEARYADFLGTSADRVVSVANATLGIQGAVTAAAVRRWAVPSFTFAATPAAVLSAGCELVWADIRSDDWWIDAESVRLDAHDGVIAVAPFGTTFSLSRWSAMESRELIIDAAASLGSALPSLEDLPATWAVIFSLHATKVLPAGEGGLVVFGDADRARSFRAWSNFGFDGRRESMTVGINAKMSEMTAAYALCSLDGWAEERADWQRAHARARKVEEELGLRTVPKVSEQLSPYWIVELEDAQAALRMEGHLADRGIGTRRWWFPACHEMHGFRQRSACSLPRTGDVAPRVLGLPMSRDLTESDFDRIASALEAVR